LTYNPLVTRECKSIPSVFIKSLTILSIKVVFFSLSTGMNPFAPLPIIPFSLVPNPAASINDFKAISTVEN